MPTLSELFAIDPREFTDPNARPDVFPEPAAPVELSPHEIAAARMQRTNAPRAEGRGKSGVLSTAEFLAPETPLDYALMFAGGPAGRGLMTAGKLGKAAVGGIVGGGVLTTADEAQAGPASKVANKISDLVSLGRYPTTTPARIHRATKEGGGYSVNLPSGQLPTEGLMMGKYANVDPRNTVMSSEEFNRAAIAAHVAKNAKALSAENAYLGTWVDPDTGKVYLDVSQRFAPEQIRQATKFGERSGQLAGYDVGAGSSFPVGNWRGFIASPEFRGRMDEMAATGRSYLEQFPTKEWWDMHGTPFERVYGEKNLPQVAGYSASTAPNTAPRENMQVMSEYMRRHIRGEPAVQPDFRMPEGTMSREAGKLMPMEASRAANLERASRGAIDELQRAKVRSEAQAMMGDPEAVVLDRHWARIGEDPSRGIFTNVEEGVVGSAPRVGGPTDYDLMADQVRQAARAANRDPRDYSADVWTGIRETIKNTNQLFGTPYRGSSITGESKSYADIFQELVERKAKHLGISVGELDKRLRSGDADLLSTMMISSPVMYGAYRQWQQAQQPQEESYLAPADL